MAGIDAESTFTSDIFRICAGSSEKIFYAHSDVLSRSTTLRKKVEERLTGGSNRHIDLTEFDEHTVAQVLEWLYGGNYTWSSFTQVPADTCEIAMPHLSGTCFVTSLSQDGSPTFSAAPYFNSDEEPSDTFSVNESQPSCVTPSSEEYEFVGSECGESAPGKIGGYRPASRVEDVVECSVQSGCTLLPDAKVFVLAKYLRLQPLQRLAYQNIRGITDSITEIEVGSSLATNILDLVRFVYGCSNTLAGPVQPLRKLVFSLVADWLPALQGPELEGLIWEGGNFAVDVLKNVESRMVAMAEEHQREIAELMSRMN
ncbi:MAG: hypothetical protein Q9207_007705 [Kuettlingeria erythrocarpa]